MGRKTLTIRRFEEPTTTTWEQRFCDVIARFCNGYPPDDYIAGWFTSSEDGRLQDWVNENIMPGAMWAQGIELIDAAERLADTPSESDNHSARTERFHASQPGFPMPDLRTQCPNCDAPSGTWREVPNSHGVMTCDHCEYTPNPEARPGAEPTCFAYLNSQLIGKPHPSPFDDNSMLLFTLADAREVMAYATHHAQQLAALREDAKRLDWLTYYNMDRISRTSVEPQFIAWNRDHESAFKDSIREAIDFARSANDGGVG